MAGYIGSATSRVDGRAKVTGEAKYAADVAADGLVYGAVVTSTIASGRIKKIDTRAARTVAGVIDVLTHENRPFLAERDEHWKDDVAPDKGSPFRPLYHDKVEFQYQPIALVLAEEWENAVFAASLVRVDYEQDKHATDLHVDRDNAFLADQPEKSRGDPGRAYASSEVKHEAEYFIPIEHHNPMELYAATAVWEDGGKLTIYDKTQGVQNVQRYVCQVFKKKPDDVRVVSAFMGGGFGSGLRPQYEVVLATLGALALQRSVRVVLSRSQMYGLGYRPASIERLTLGANRDGSLNALTQEAIAITSRFEDFFRNDTAWGGVLYKSADRRYEHWLARVDLPTPCDMRAPGAATGVYALECAMDELAVALDMDPIALRLKCYSDREQNQDLPFTSKALRECYTQGADAFGWSKRDPVPRSMREGTELVGWGMATGVWEALQMPAAARIVLTANGHAEVSCSASDIGTGTYTIIAQVAADALGLPIENIGVKLGDSSLPQAPVEGGSWMAASASHAVISAAEEIRKALLAAARTADDSPLAGARPDDVTLAEGKLVLKRDQTRGVSIADAMRHSGAERIVKEKKHEFSEDSSHARNTHSAVFAEVKIDEELGIIRVTRVVSAVAAGRILNTKTASSQIMGAIVGGIGMALHEETQIDHRFGRIMNANIAEYHVPVNADIHDIKVIFVEEKDNKINALGMKGVGEIGIVGVAAAIANAVYHATGKRVRDLPITLDKSCEGLRPESQVRYVPHPFRRTS